MKKLSLGLALAGSLALSFTALAEPSLSPYIKTVNPNGWIQTTTRFLNTESTNVTVEIWVRPMTSDMHHLIEQYSAGGLGRQNFRLFKIDDNRMYVHNWLGGNNNNTIPGQELRSDDSVSTVPVGEWTHIAWVCDGTIWRLYINGELNIEQDGFSTDNHLDQNGADGFVIGNSRTSNPNGSSNAFFAEARLWKRARTSAEIKEWYNKRIPKAWNEPDLIGYWPMVEGQETVEKNGGFRNYATMHAVNNPNSNSYTWYYAKYSSSCVTFPETDKPVPITGELDGDDGALSCSGSMENGCIVDTRAFDNPHNFTLMAWFLRRTTGGSAWPNTYFGKSTGGNGRLLVREWDGKLHFWMGGGNGGKTNEELQVELPTDKAGNFQWHHIAYVKDDQTVRMYLNGEPLGEGGPFELDMLNTQSLQFGGFEAGGSRSIYSGLIKNASFWKKAMTAKEIQTYMTTNPRGDEHKLIGYWPFDDGDGNEARNLKVGAPNAVMYPQEPNQYWKGTNLSWQTGANMPVVKGTLPKPGMMLRFK